MSIGALTCSAYGVISCAVIAHALSVFIIYIHTKIVCTLRDDDALILCNRSNVVILAIDTKCSITVRYEARWALSALSIIEVLTIWTFAET